MARYDKYDPISGGFRAPLAAQLTGQAAPRVVSLDVNGRVVVGAGNTGVKGVLCLPVTKPAGTVVDVMTDGEITDFAGVAGTNYRGVEATGVVEAGAAGVDQIYVGHTVEATRLVVRVGRAQS